jgi:hypothetical protein
MEKAEAQGTNANRMRMRPRAVSRNLMVVSLAVLLVTVSSAPPRARGESSNTSEYDVKAAFLFHFAQFVEWPAGTFKDASSPLTYCTIGGDPFAGALDQSLSEKTIGARPLRVQHIKLPRETPSCQVLFVGAGENKLLAETMATVGGRPVLTVGETEHFVADGGVIGFVVEANKIRFEVNLEAAEKANLKISARLLALAKTVIGNPRGN